MSSVIHACSLKDLELNRDFNGEDYEYEDEAKLVIFPDHFEIPLPNIEELPALVSELILCVSVHAARERCTWWFPASIGGTSLHFIKKEIYKSVFSCKNISVLPAAF